jgi:DNA-binding NarL/FixJ family response regulator
MILEPPTAEAKSFPTQKTRSDLARVLLADDHEPVLERAATVLRRHFEVIGTVTDGNMLVKEALRLRPDIIVADILMPGLNGIDAVRELRELGCEAKFVFMSVYRSPEFVKACLSVGASGYVTKDRMGVDLLHAIQEAQKDRQFISSSIADF